jgi:hypothetical protein
VDGEDFDALAAAMGRWGAEQRAEDAARARRRVGWLRRQAAETATLAGVLVDLAERSAPVTLETIGGRYEGQVEVVSTGLCALRRGDGGVTLVAMNAVTALWGPDVVASGDRTPSLQLDMAGALTALAADGNRVTVGLAGGAEATGVVETVGVELVCLAGDQGSVLIALDAVTACWF